ncbi:MAG: transporter permease [Gammaproteobacteria bacterium]|jgi:hypothetical protein|nr:transporter permease [Gammaproteobacteria bacterium]
MLHTRVVFTEQEKKWLLEHHIARETDNKAALIYPMGAERFLSSVLFGNRKWQNNYDIRADIEDKDVLVIPGYGNSSFLFAAAGAKSVTVYDKDPVTITWMRAFKKYYHYRGNKGKRKGFPSIGELLDALTCGYPPVGILPTGKLRQLLLRLFNPQALRRSYIFYMLLLVRQAVEKDIKDDFDLNKDIQFYVGGLQQLLVEQKNKCFDTAFVPYLLGVENGIEEKQAIVDFVKKLVKIVPNGHLLITPSRSTKEFRVVGKRYFVTTGYDSIQAIPELQPYVIKENRHWFETQGLMILGENNG